MVPPGLELIRAFHIIVRDAGIIIDKYFRGVTF
jgi:hypothetical protein